MNSSSIGIIGGADGPTAIFVATSQPLWLSLLCLAGAVIVAVLIIRWIVKRIKKK